MDSKIESTQDTANEVNMDAVNNEAPHSIDTAKHKKSKKKGAAFWTLLVLVVLTIVVVAGYATSVYIKNTEKAKVPAPTHFASADALVTAAATEVRGTVPALGVTNTIGGLTESGQLVYTLPAMQVSGYDFQTQPVNGIGKGYVSTWDVAVANYKQFKTFFEDNRYTLVIKLDTPSLVYGTGTTAEKYAVYESDEMLCSIWHIKLLGSSLGTDLASIGCAQKADYAPAAKAAAPYYAAYAKANTTSKDDPIVMGPVLSKGASDAYEYAVLYVEDKQQTVSEDDTYSLNGYFYKKKTDSDWTFAMVARDNATCESFNTNVLKAAFTGVTCVDSATQQTRSL